ncbi:hypothetical protein [Bradyrhizobium sp.]|uniref:hypothetical protein n=1 Tax=Bradyrhizobium sp. TaxID=376 RepID=UPI0025C731B4|nr:hypothetical protein [Bradyrhizobium sp.]
MHVTETTEKQNQTEQPEATIPTKKSSRKSVLALAVLALGINSTAAIYTMSPAGFDLPNINLPSMSSLAELLPHQKASDPFVDPVVATLTALQENKALLQENSVLLLQDSIAIASLRQSVMDEQSGVKKISAQIADEHQDVKKISAQISALTAKVDSLRYAMSPEFTSSISARHANRLARAARKKMARQPNPVGPISLGGAPLTLPATTPAPES